MENAVGCAFLEHVGENPRARALLSRFLTPEEFRLMLHSGLGNLLSNRQRRQLETEFHQHRNAASAQRD